jgi:hypothetical protein
VGKTTAKKILEWIERIPKHIQHIIKCKGGNKYKEGLERSRKWNADRDRP